MLSGPGRQRCLCSSDRERRRRNGTGALHRLRGVRLASGSARRLRGSRRGSVRAPGVRPDAASAGPVRGRGLARSSRCPAAGGWNIPETLQSTWLLAGSCFSEAASGQALAARSGPQRQAGKGPGTSAGGAAEKKKPRPSGSPCFPRASAAGLWPCLPSACSRVPNRAGRPSAAAARFGCRRRRRRLRPQAATRCEERLRKRGTGGGCQRAAGWLSFRLDGTRVLRGAGRFGRGSGGACPARRGACPGTLHPASRCWWSWIPAQKRSAGGCRKAN